jgi:Gram-negative bacterial TonB protein C-terminal
MLKINAFAILFFIGVTSCKEKVEKFSSEECSKALYFGNNIDGDSVYFNPDTFAKFGKDKFELFDYLEKETVYPKIAKENNITGRVYVQFIILKSGDICCIDVNEYGANLEFGCREETYRIIKNMSKWIPAKNKGENVNSKFTFPVLFGEKY